jgi:hypothetical protein
VSGPCGGFFLFLGSGFVTQTFATLQLLEHQRQEEEEKLRKMRSFKVSAMNNDQSPGSLGACCLIGRRGLAESVPALLAGQ